jgi:hypothetical protein
MAVILLLVAAALSVTDTTDRQAIDRKLTHQWNVAFFGDT